MADLDDRPAPDQRLDATGLKCPLPVLRARKAMKEVPAGGVLEVRATDPGSVQDFAQFCETTGHSLIGREDADDGVHIFYLRKQG